MKVSRTMLVMTLLTAGFCSNVAQASLFMDAEWASKACAAWNENEILTRQLVKTEDNYRWITNDAGRGYKLIQLYRTNCSEPSKIQLDIALQEGKAMCTYGGEPDGKAFNPQVDYLLHATDPDWMCIGEGEFGCGAMGAMMSGRLNFTGPKMEVMDVMEAFSTLLRMTAEVPGLRATCPTIIRVIQPQPAGTGANNPPPDENDAVASSTETDPAETVSE